MNNCCTQNQPSKHSLKSHECPINGKPYNSVKRKTLLHHILQPWRHTLAQQSYYFCNDPACDVVYFGKDNSVFHSNELRTRIWQKSPDESALLCYCFGITKEYARKNKSIKTFIAEQTKKSLCACETSNPSGRCCLKDFAKL